MLNTRNSVMTRRTAVAALASGTVAALTGCLSIDGVEPPDPRAGRLSARPMTPSASPPATGTSPLPASLAVDGRVYMPPNYSPAKPAAVAVLFHGASGDADELIEPLAPLAATRNLILLATTSVGFTWDLMGGRFRDDILGIDRALAWLFQRCVVDTARVGIVGFSDGASYALGVGRTNGDLFRRVVMYSPGTLLDIVATGNPEFFITHGTEDRVLPVETTRNRIVPTLRYEGYRVEYREFSGGHGATAALIEETTAWFVR